MLIKFNRLLHFYFQVKEIDPDNKEADEQIQKCKAKGFKLNDNKVKEKKKSSDSDSDSDWIVSIWSEYNSFAIEVESYV